MKEKNLPGSKKKTLICNMEWQSELAECVACLQSGGVLLYPTDTIWGLGCDPRNGAAVQKIFDLKGRSADKGLILLANSMSMVEKLVDAVPPMAHALMAEAGERPLTIVYPSGRGVVPQVLAPDGSMAIRIPADPFCLALIQALGHPITSTSANISGDHFPGSFEFVDRHILNGVDYVVHWRQSEEIIAASSRIVKLLPDGGLQVVRP